MADPVDMTKQGFKIPFVPPTNAIPPEVAAAIRGGLGGDANAVPPPLPTGDAAVNAAEPPPQNVLNALTSGDNPVPPAPNFVPGQPQNAPVPENPLNTLATPLPPTKPQLAPHKTTVGERIRKILPYVGAIGGALEAAGGPVGHAPVGAEMLQQSIAAQRAAAMARAKLENVEIPEAQARSNYYNSFNPTKVGVAKIGAEAKESVAETGAETKTALGRYKAVPGVGLFDTQTRQVIPGTEQGVILTPDMVKNYDLPPEFVGRPVKITDLAAKERSQAMNIVPVQGAQGPALANKRQGTAKTLGLGNPGAAARQAGVSDAVLNGNVVPMTDAQRLAAGAPKAGTVESVGKAQNKIYDPAVEADTRLKQMYEQATDVSGASDMALLFNHIAMTGGNVKGLRMGQFLTDEHRKARSIPEDLGALWNHVAAGQVLSPQQRVNFVRLAENVRQTRWDAAQRQASQMGIDQPPPADPDLPAVRAVTDVNRPARPAAQKVAGPGATKKPAAKKDTLGIL